MITLRPYQLAIKDAVLRSIHGGHGTTFSVEISRQGGKNELSAQLEVLLMAMNFINGGNIIKASPTFKPQTINSKLRLEDRLRDWGFGRAYTNEHGYIVKLGNARCVFMSADLEANVVGQTAHILLEIDESQDVNKDKYTKEFKPMGATTNATCIHYGTTWDDTTLLEEIKQTNLELTRKDGVQRHFRYDWEEVAKYNPAYRKYVEGERDRLGALHPLFLTQYCLVPLKGGGRFFNEQQLAQLRGSHHPQRNPTQQKTYVAALDVAGEAEVTDDQLMSVSGRDSSVMFIAELQHMPDGRPLLHIVQVYVWLGEKHSTLEDTFVDLIKNVWNISAIAVDATGIGEPVASHLTARCGPPGRIIPFKFTQQSKSHLAFGLQSAVNTGRLKMFEAPAMDEYNEFWKQAQLCLRQFRPNQTMNFYVDPSKGHDDFISALALLVEASENVKERIAKGRSR